MALLTQPDPETIMYSSWNDWPEKGALDDPLEWDRSNSVDTMIGTTIDLGPAADSSSSQAPGDTGKVSKKF